MNYTLIKRSNSSDIGIAVELSISYSSIAAQNDNVAVPQLSKSRSRLDRMSKKPCGITGLPLIEERKRMLCDSKIVLYTSQQQKVTNMFINLKLGFAFRLVKMSNKFGKKH